MLFTSLLAITLLFIVSLGIVIFASAHFTRKLGAFCEMFQFSPGILSLMSALGANIPNYVSAAAAIMGGHMDLGMGIILGSNIYNIAIILGLCTLFTPTGNGIHLNTQERHHVRKVAWYMFAITLGVWWMSALLPGSPFTGMFSAVPLMHILLLFSAILIFAIFGGFLVYILRYSHPEHVDAVIVHHAPAQPKTPLAIVRLSSEILILLAIALGGVMVMVQSGQILTNDLHIPTVLTGLLVLAVATSLPNTIVAISLVRIGKVAACTEEICSSASINIVLGIVLPGVIWAGALQDRFLLFLDSPFLLILTAGVLYGLVRGRLSRLLGIVLLGLYVVWVVLRFWV
ncbi:MAG: sodium:calcium antiporter [Ktedonobacteraceae bacterium]